MAKKQISAYKKLMASVRKDISRAKMKGKKVKSECCHRGGKKYWIRKVKGEDSVFRCTECRAKIDFRPLQKVAEDPKELRNYIKDLSKEYRNLLNIAKILHDKKDDAKILKYISEITFGTYRLQDYLVAMIADQFEPRRKKKSGNKKRRPNSKIMGGGRSLGRRMR